MIWLIAIPCLGLLAYVGLAVYILRDMAKYEKKIDADIAAMDRAYLERKFHV